MSQFEDLREDVLSSYVALNDLVIPYLADTRRRLLEESRNRLAAGRFYVVVCGEFRRGKSSLLNALVERPGLFPVDVDITTCAVVTLQWDSRDSATVYFAETEPGDPASAQKPEQIRLEDAGTYVKEQENPGNAKNVLRIDMGATIEQLKSGLVLVDTPGVGSLNPGHTAATRAFLPNADAILFVASAVEPLSVPELNFLKLALSKCPIVVTALTMIDRVVSAAPVVAEARTRIATVTGTGAELVIVPVSSFRKRDALEEGDQDLLVASGFPELEAEIWGGLAITCGAAQIHDALDEMGAALAEAAAPIANSIAALRGDASKTDADLRAIQEQFRQLKAQSHDWRRDLASDLDRAARPIQRQLDGDLDAIRDQFRTALGTDEAISDPNAIVQRMSDAMVDAANRANSALETEMAQIAHEYTKITELPITASNVDHPSFSPGMTAASPQVRRMPQGYARFREMWLGASAGAGAGAVLGTLVPVIGTAVGAVVGFFVGLFGGRRHQQRNAEEQQRRAYIADLRDHVLPKLDAGRRQLSRDMSDQVRDYSRALLRMLDDNVEAKGESIAESIRLLNETKKRDEAGRAAQERDLSRQQQELDGLRAELDTMRTRTSNLTRQQSGR
jgi:gas vesicle protein